MKTTKILVFLLLFTVLTVQTMPAEASSVSALQAGLTFEDLGLASDIILRGPYDANDIRFDLPPSWVLLDETTLWLEITTYIVGADGGDASTEGGLDTYNNYVGAVLDVYFNDELQRSISLVKGENITYTIPVALSDLTSPYGAGWHKISFFLDATIDCDFGFHQTTVVISSMSEANLSYEEVPPKLDLHRLPWPIYQERANMPDPVWAVLPSSPSSDEVQAGLTAMGAFGRMTFGRLPIKIITEDQLSDEILATSNLIFVGKPSSFTTIQPVNAPLQFTAGGFSASDVNGDDGVLQIITSPWNSTKTLLMISGNTDQGVVKAAQALSTGNIQTGLLPTYSVVAQVNTFSEPGIQIPGAIQVFTGDFTFADLGDDFITVDDLGENYLEYEFIIPQGQVPAENPYLELHYSNSALADLGRSGISIYLNDALIGSVKFSPESSTLLSAKIDLPSSAIRSGYNLMEVVIDLIPIDECLGDFFSGVWATIHPDSLVHLPLIPAANAPFVVGNVNSFPFPFASDPSFISTAFVLPDDRVAWGVAGDIAYSFGSLVPGTIFAPETFFDSQLPENYQDNHLVIVGMPTDLSLISEMELKGALPAYFEPGSNIAVLETQQILYRISDQKSLGYLELVSSPWREERAVLGVFGTTNDGLGFAGAALVNSQARQSFLGNFITLDGEKALVVDTKTGLGTGRVESSLGTDTVSQEENIAPVEDFSGSQEAMRRTILYVSAGIVFAMTVVVVLALRFRKKR